MRKVILTASLCLIGFTAHANDLVTNNNDINATQMATPTCVTYPEWTGSNIDTIDLGILDDRPYRILKPDAMMTMDYSPDRLNIQTTAEGIIITQDCG